MNLEELTEKLDERIYCKQCSGTGNINYGEEHKPRRECSTCGGEGETASHEVEDFIRALDQARD